MEYTFEERIPDRSDTIFIKFYENTKTPWRKATNWTYDPFLKRGYFNIKGDATPYPLSEKSEYWKV